MYRFLRQLLRKIVQRTTNRNIKRRKENPTLEDRLKTQFDFYGLSTHPIIRQVKTIVHQDKKTHRAKSRTAIVLVFTLGVLADHSLYGLQVSVIHDLLAAWRQQHERDYRNHHDLKPVSKIQARAIAGQFDRERDLQDKKDKRLSEISSPKTTREAPGFSRGEERVGRRSD